MNASFGRRRGDQFRADQDLGTEPGCLGMDTRRQFRTADPLLEAWVVFDTGARAGLAAGCDRLDDDRAESFGGAVERCGQPGRAGADNDDVILFACRSARQADPFGELLLESRRCGIGPFVLLRRRAEEACPAPRDGRSG